MSAGALDITIEQGATFNHTLTWHEYDEDNPPNYEGDVIDLTGYTARMHIRKTKNTDDFLIELTTENGRIALGDALGTIVLTIAATDTEQLSFTTGVFDLELVNGTTVVRLVEGAATLSKEATKPASA